jgi:iron(III) transport system permease protein
VSAIAQARPPVQAQVKARPRRRPVALLAGSTLIALGVLLPLAFLVIQAVQAGFSPSDPQSISRLLWRSLTGRLLVNTVELAVCVTLLCTVIGTAAAYATERTNLPLRRIWTALIVLPLAIPDFIVGYTWSSIAPGLHGLAGATLVMTLSLNPLIYLPVAAALRNGDPALEEAARSLGLGPWAVFRRVTLRQLRPAVLGGALLVCLALLAEFGAFEILRFQTFTTEIYTEFQVAFAGPTACALSLVLVALGLLVMLGRGALAGHGPVSRRTGAARRPPARIRLGRRRAAPVLLGLAALTGLSLGVPLATLGYWLSQPRLTTLPQEVSVPAATVTTLLYAALAAVGAVVLALPVAFLAERHPGRAARLIERATLTVQGLPGLAIALALVFFSVHFFFGLYQSPLLMVAAYAIMFFPLALVSVRTGVAHAPARLAEVGRSLGRRPPAVFLRVTVPLIAPGLAAGFCLVFISVTTELTATLILLPTGISTLATQFWGYQNDQSYAAAAPYAAAIVAIAMVPSYLLGRWFDRTRSADSADKERHQ